MSLTLVRRVTATLPYNHFLFRCEPKWTKNEIKEYLEKVYKVNVARIATSISLGKIRRNPNSRLHYKLKDFKKVYVRISDSNSAVSEVEKKSEEIR